MASKETKARKGALRTIFGCMACAAGWWGVHRALRMLFIGAGYKAKILCSGVFLARREPEAILNCDLVADNLGILRLIHAEIDFQSQQVTTSFLGLIKRKALFRPGLGSSLIYDSAPPSLPLPSHTPGLAPGPSEMVERSHPRLDPALDWAFSEPDPAHLRRTRAVVILHHGRIVAERYAPGFGKDTPLLGWSMTKGVVNALVGVLVKEGRLSLDGQVAVPEWQGWDDPRRKITLRHLLQMSSGLRFCETYGNPLQDVTMMLLAVPDAAAYAAAKPLVREPGSKWSYSSGTTNIISRLIRHTLGDRAYSPISEERPLRPHRHDQRRHRDRCFRDLRRFILHVRNS